MDDFEKELKIDFLTESYDLIIKCEQAFLELDTSGVNPHLLDEIFRLAHNLKGTSRAVGFADIAELTHQAENLILKIKQGEVTANKNVISLLLKFNDQVLEMVTTLKENLDERFDTLEMQKNLELASQGKLTDEEDTTTEELNSNNNVEDESQLAINQETVDDMSKVSDIFDKQSEELILENNTDEEVLTAHQEELLQDLDNLKIHFANEKNEEPNTEQKIEKIVQPQDVIPKKELRSETKQASNSSEDESIRVSINRIDKLNNSIGEMVILQTVLQQRKNIHIDDDISNKSIHQLSKISKEIQQLVMSLRMIPIKSTFQKLTRIVRDTSQSLNKKVELVIKGETTEVDKTILEKLSDPLVHIIRNAVDHGIESSETERIQLGKNEKGKIIVMAEHRSGQLYIEVSDDGKGINPEIISKKAIQKGIIKEGHNLSPQQVIQLIFHPGFSTKEQVTEVSGRGVGMDVVKTNIESLGGEVKIESVVGKGSQFQIYLPLTLAITDAMIIEQGGQRFIIPLSQIQEFIRIEEETLYIPHNLGKFLKLRGDIVPLVDLTPLVSKTKTVGPNAKGKMILVFQRTSGKKSGIIVENILNQQQVVIKPIGKELSSFKGAIGCSILGDGRPAFILDLQEVFTQLAPSQLIDKRQAITI